jgi:hypothetical protein
MANLADYFREIYKLDQEAIACKEVSEMLKAIMKNPQRGYLDWGDTTEETKDRLEKLGFRVPRKGSIPPTRVYWT